MPVICPSCRSPIDLDPSAAPAEVVCTACGSTFRLDDAADTATGTADWGRTLGRFEVLRELGRGAFGTVYQARDPQLDRTVALKVPRAGLVGPADSDRVLREARSAARLRHAGIVSVYEVGEADGGPVLVCEFVDGVSLDQWLSAKRTTFRQAAELVAALADALQYAHAQGVVHRDVKPSNVLLEGGDPARPRLADFGLARRDAADVTVTVEGQVLGTPAYMSPEQARGEGHRADARADVYSLGVVLYELLAGERPFRGTAGMLLHQVLHDDPPPPRRLNDRIPRDLETVCLKCLEKEPGRRYATAGELAEELRRDLRGEPVRARPVGRAERAWRWAKRHRAVAALSASLALLLLAAAAGGSLAAWRFWQNAVTEGRLRADAEATSDRLAVSLYQRNVALAAREVFARNAGRADELLDACPAERRGWEWHLVKRLCGEDPLVMPGFEAIAFRPDNRALATARLEMPSRRWRITVWELPTGRLLRTLDSHPLTPHLGTSEIRGLAFSPDGQTLASTGEHVVRLWDLADGRLVRTFTGPTDGLGNVAFSPDGRLLVAGSKDRNVYVWEVGTGRAVHVLTGHQSHARRVVFSPDGSRLASASWDSTVRVWDLGAGREVVTFRGHRSSVQGVAFSPDGASVVSGDGDGEVKTWDALSGAERQRVRGHGGAVEALAFTADGTRFASAGQDGTVKVWRQDGGELVALSAHTEMALGVAFSPDGRYLASAGYDGKAKVWDAAEWRGEGEPGYWYRRGDELLRAGENQEGLAALDRAVALQPEARKWRGARAWSRFGLGLWGPAADDLAQMPDPDDQNDWAAYVFASLATGEPERYRRACAAALAHLGESTDPAANSYFASLCAWGPGGVEDPARPVRMAEPAAARWANNRVFLFRLALTLYRAGRLDDAARHLERAVEVSQGGSVSDWLLLALVEQKRGRVPQAEQWWKRCAGAFAAQKPGVKWTLDRLELDLLRRQAEAAIAPQPPVR